MRKAFRTSLAFAGAAFIAGWMYRQAFPKIGVPEVR